MNYILLIVMLFFCSSCTTMESLDGFYQDINYKDGIDRDEAKLIAKQYLVDSKYSGDFQVWGPMVAGEKNNWVVSFLYKSLDAYEQILDVYVDTLTGEVKDAKIRRKSTPAVTYDSNGKF